MDFVLIELTFSTELAWNNFSFIKRVTDISVLHIVVILTVSGGA